MSEQSQEFARLAGEAIREGNFASAIDLANQALAIDPHSADAFIALGIAQAQSGQPDAATSSLRHAISIAPNNPKGYYNLATHQYQLNHKMEAIAMAEEALRLDPTFTAAKNLMTLIQSEFDASHATHATASELETLPTMAPPPSMPPSQMSHAPQSHSHPSHSPMGGPGVRPGYAPTSNHGLPFVQNMGGAWDAIGYILQFGLLVLFIGMLAAILPMWGEMMTFAQQHPGDREGMNNFIRTNSPGWLPVIQIFTFVFFVGNIVWTALDIADRKNSWAWMIVTVCCWPITFLYVVAGRK